MIIPFIDSSDLKKGFVDNVIVIEDFCPHGVYNPHRRITKRQHKRPKMKAHTLGKGQDTT